MKLFDEFDRNYSKGRDEGEPRYAYWNRSDRSGFEYLRDVVEGWFADFNTNDDKKASLKRDFQSDDDREHLSAFFELYIHRLLTQMGYQVQIEPEMPNGSKPDFLVTNADSEQIIVEATGIYPESIFGSMSTLKDNLRKKINQYVKTSDFWVSIDFFSDPEPGSNPPVAKIARYLNYELKKIDTDELNRKYEASGNWNDVAPIIPPYPNDDWEITFQVFPTNSPQPKDESPIGIQTTGWKVIDTITPLRSRIDSKYAH